MPNRSPDSNATMSDASARTYMGSVGGMTAGAMLATLAAMRGRKAPGAIRPPVWERAALGGALGGPIGAALGHMSHRRAMRKQAGLLEDKYRIEWANADDPEDILSGDVSQPSSTLRTARKLALPVSLAGAGAGALLSRGLPGRFAGAATGSLLGFAPWALTRHIREKITPYEGVDDLEVRDAATLAGVPGGWRHATTVPGFESLNGYRPVGVRATKVSETWARLRREVER